MVHVGACSWTEKTLLQSGEFYPGRVRTAETRLRFYSEQFDTVEVDSTYYAIPSKSIAHLWSERTPEEFVFHIKVYGALTGHGIDPRTLPPDIRSELPEKERSERNIYVKAPGLLGMIAERFLDALSPLKGAGKLGVLVFQFPPWFVYRKESLEAILGFKRMMAENIMAVEFRHGSWYAADARDEVFRFLRQNRIVHVAADEPQFGTLATVPFVPETTADISYFRLHGRNRENWLKKGVETSLRYAYLYSDEELEGFIPRIRSSADHSRETYVMFNNCHGGFAMRNAQRIRALMRERTERN